MTVLHTLRVYPSGNFVPGHIVPETAGEWTQNSKAVYPHCVLYINKVRVSNGPFPEQTARRYDIIAQDHYRKLEKALGKEFL